MQFRFPAAFLVWNGNGIGSSSMFTLSPRPPHMVLNTLPGKGRGMGGGGGEYKITISKMFLGPFLIGLVIPPRDVAASNRHAASGRLFYSVDFFLPFNPLIRASRLGIASPADSPGASGSFQGTVGGGFRQGVRAYSQNGRSPVTQPCVCFSSPQEKIMPGTRPEISGVINLSCARSECSVCHTPHRRDGPPRRLVVFPILVMIIEPYVYGMSKNNNTLAPCSWSLPPA